MGRKRLIKSNEAIEAIEKLNQPFASTGDLAEHFDVTRQAIRDSIGRFEANPEIKIGDVGNSTVFYLSNDTGLGRPRKDVVGQITTLLTETDRRAMTLGEISDEVDAARATVKKRLDGLDERGYVESEKIGNATAYWME